ncbi:hypothetical protein [Mycobacterium attenuatum]|uniref:hypothetical protein n=1 Tax=Mycobacterium attenuatum TaxID=2341086 RepID=UPI0010A95309|nr:hypothetical protein [Mycobacterium attenuatum]
MTNRKTLEQARRQARERLAKAQQERAEREGKSVDDAAEVMRARTRVGEVDEWESERVGAVAVEADRKRAEHHKTAAAAVARMRARGDSIKTIALLADMSESQVRKYLRPNHDSPAAPADESSADEHRASPPSPRGAASVDSEPPAPSHAAALTTARSA